MRSPTLPLLAAALALLTLVPTADAAGRRRAVRQASLGCSYAVAPSIATPVVQDGVSQMQVAVQGVTSQCASWSAWSTASWITVEVSTTSVFLTLAPNPSDQPRTGTVTIAGHPYEVTQLGRTNLLVNGSFNDDLFPWGWGSFPNSTGTKTWSSLDANGDPTSGSMRLRDTKLGDQAYQQMQCVNAPTGVYEYGFSIRGDGTQRTQAVIAFLNFSGPDCTGTYPAYGPKAVTPDEAGVWETHSYLGKLVSGHKSLMIVIASYARESAPANEVWIDDVFVRPND